ncbi:MAG: cutinase family protein [Gordonia sp. (in: high G+C Gram-positive bacteria)]|uniref:cutinase family protein n=1 Tax=Gordonia sp. (in: high G+C Gram-positive bacteria) TaxID=84139 RepID=UPI0039E5CE27
MLALFGAVLSPPNQAWAACDGVIVVPGTGDTNYGNSGGVQYGSQAQVIKRATDKGKDVTVVEYPTTLWPAGGVGFDKDVAIGNQATMKAVAEYMAKCPDGKVEVVGYSQGGRIAGDVLSDIGNGRYDDYGLEPDEIDALKKATEEGRISGTLYSDPRQVGVSGFDGRGIETSFVGVIPGLTMSGPRENGFGDLSGNVRTLCSQGDGICYLADPIKDPLGAIDSFLGYFVKHGDYPLKGWMAVDPGGAPGTTVGWENGLADATSVKCEDRGANGRVCVAERPSTVTLLLRDLASSLGVDPNSVPDIYRQVQSVLNLNGVLPNVGVASLQPVVKLIYSALPQLPYLTYHAGGYLPDLFAALNLVTGIGPALGGDTTQLVAAATDIARSVGSILAIPVNGAIYWGNQVGGLFGHPNLMGKQWSIGFISAEEGPGHYPFDPYPGNWSPSGAGSALLASGPVTGAPVIEAPTKAELVATVNKAEESKVYQTALRQEAVNAAGAGASDSTSPGVADRAANRRGASTQRGTDTATTVPPTTPAPTTPAPAAPTPAAPAPTTPVRPAPTYPRSVPTFPRPELPKYTPPPVPRYTPQPPAYTPSVPTVPQYTPPVAPSPTVPVPAAPTQAAPTAPAPVAPGPVVGQVSPGQPAG